MLKLLTGLTLIALMFAATPVYATQSGAGGGGGTIGPGCTLDPFNHTMNCIDWTKCKKNKNGQKVCPVTTTKTN